VHKRLAALFLMVIWSPWVAADDRGFHGLLRGRDLTAFGYLRLVMRP